MALKDELVGFAKWAGDSYVAIETSKRPPAATPQPEIAAGYIQNSTTGNYAASGADAGVVNNAQRGNVVVGGVPMSKTILTGTALLLAGFGAVKLLGR